MGKITIFARMGVKRANVENLKALAAEGCKVASDEPGTLTYDWHYSEEHGSLVLVGTYADSSAHFAHMQADGHGDQSLVDRLGLAWRQPPLLHHDQPDRPHEV